MHMKGKLQVAYYTYGIHIWLSIDNGNVKYRFDAKILFASLSHLERRIGVSLSVTHTHTH